MWSVYHTLYCKVKVGIYSLGKKANRKVFYYNPSAAKAATPTLGRLTLKSPPCVKGDVSEADRGIALYNPSVVQTNDSTPASPAELHTGEPKMKKAPMWEGAQQLRGPRQR